MAAALFRTRPALAHSGYQHQKKQHLEAGL